LLSFLSFHDRFVLFKIFLYDEECCSEFVIHRRLIIFFFERLPLDLADTRSVLCICWTFL
jgi:hypothetical protein